MLSVSGLSSKEPTRLRELRQVAASAGLNIEAAGGNWNPHGDGSKFASTQDHDAARARVREWLAIAEALGATILRGLLGGAGARHALVPLETQMTDTAQVLKDLAPDAAARNIRLAPELHWDLTAREMVRMLEAVGDERVGVTYDSGNPFCLLEDPLEAAELLQDRIISTHMRDAAIRRTHEGVVVRWCVMGCGSARLREIRAVIERANPNCVWNLEVIFDYPPIALPYLSPAFWTPGWQLLPAEQLARFEALLASNAAWTEEADWLKSRDDGSADELRQQEWQGFMRSWAYCRDVLGIPGRPLTKKGSPSGR